MSTFNLHHELGLAQAKRELAKLKFQAAQQLGAERIAREQEGYRRRLARTEQWLESRPMAEWRRLTLEAIRLRLQLELHLIPEGGAEREITQLYRAARDAYRESVRGRRRAGHG